jgi:hypothetical protein
MIGLSLAALASASFAPASAQGSCEFKLGFKALRDQIPEQVGVCLEDEHFNVANGNAEQRTTAHHGRGGLLVWRKADNWTAFTDGHRTWVNGPYGLQTRLNSERFDWEAPIVEGVPEAVLRAARSAAARRLNVPQERVTIVRAEPVEWPDASLGCPEPGRVYAQVITPGFRLVAQESDQLLEVHADAVGRAVVCV